MFIKKIEVNANYGANTLDTAWIGDNASGWAIEGEIQHDYYEWVNEFKAQHIVHGKVWGDFEKTVYADTEEGFADFIKHHPPESWDYGDI